MKSNEFSDGLDEGFWSDFATGLGAKHTGASLRKPEDTAWNQATNLNSPEAYQSYLDKYPKGYYADQANSKLNKQQVSNMRLAAADSAKDAATFKAKYGDSSNWTLSPTGNENPSDLSDNSILLKPGQQLNIVIPSNNPNQNPAKFHKTQSGWFNDLNQPITNTASINYLEQHANGGAGKIVNIPQQRTFTPAAKSRAASLRPGNNTRVPNTLRYPQQPSRQPQAAESKLNKGTTMNESSINKAKKLINEYTVKEMAVRRLKKEKLAEAKLSPKPVRQEFRQVSYEEFEHLGDFGSNHVERYYDETQIDGKWVMALYSGKDCVGMYYTTAQVGSYCPTFQGDELSYSEQDPNWPYGD